ncbi:MAG: hypothetical protein OEV23_05780 [Gallionella sp.]|nr:hypothetical protein [Gallionella sp.]
MKTLLIKQSVITPALPEPAGGHADCCLVMAQLPNTLQTSQKVQTTCRVPWCGSNSSQASITPRQYFRGYTIKTILKLFQSPTSFFYGLASLRSLSGCRWRILMRGGHQFLNLIDILASPINYPDRLPD